MLNRLTQIKYKISRQRRHDGFIEINSFNHFIIWVVAALILILLLWAHFAVIDESTSAPGKVIPSKKIQLVQNLEGGILEDIYVEEGQKVKKGQALAKINNSIIENEYQQNMVTIQALKIKLLRLIAETNNKPFVIPKNLQNDTASLAESEKHLAESRHQELEFLSQKQNALKEEIDMTKPLVNDGTISKVSFLRLKQQLSEIDGKIHHFKSDAFTQLNSTKTELTKAEKKQQTLNYNQGRTEVKSSVDGIVKQIHVSTVGGVIKPGMNIMEIVPIDDQLLIETKVSPRNIGFIHPNQNVAVKVSAYDFSIYGGIKGKVTHISADTSVDDKGNSFYEVWVKTNKNYLEHNNKHLQIIPGMQVTANIITGKKSVLNYILKPILKAKQESLREK